MLKRGPYKKPETLPQYRINQRITASQVRLIGGDNKQIGVVTLAEALNQAWQAEVDLVEVAPKASPPVVKIIDYKKFMYLESKRLAQQKKGAKRGELKELRLKPFMADGDLEVRVKRVKEFFKDGHPVRLSVLLQGRQIAYKDFGFDAIRKLMASLNDSGKYDQEPKLMGRKVIAVISANKK